MRLLSQSLINGFFVLKESQKLLESDLKKYNFASKIVLKNNDKNFVMSFKVNFFTILMLSLLLESKIDKNRCVLYGKIILLIRQIVTSVDNVLDKERKGIIFIEGLSNLVVENAMMTLICQNILTEDIIHLERKEKIGNLNIRLLDKIYSIANGENLRRRNLYDRYPSMSYIETNIHRYIGGELLDISLFIPSLVEKNEKLELFSKGLFKIGMSLQGLDDFFDMKEDFENEDINLATSEYIELFSIKENEINFENIDSKFTKNYIERIISLAYEGFELLKSGGYPIDRSTGRFVLKKLFILRGLKDYVHYIK
ncbi:hypothetical protein [Fusobacterium hominis]|uniref:Uncharacterized protein n=1 Tax=Fusobacterium hominis TaxID=2764326 RepID=A0A7G9GYN8_9FUSO|nr:hypothetical protein [Fusobacterium hominis]QNM15920.1 hypothetical protein H9Q81_03540 [Fusobacterium hominis]